MSQAEIDAIKKYLTVSEVIDRCLLSGLEESNIEATEPIRIVSINNVQLKNEVSGICTIGFIKAQVDRKKQLADQLQKFIKE